LSSAQQAHPEHVSGSQHGYASAVDTGIVVGVVSFIGGPPSSGIRSVVTYRSMIVNMCDSLEPVATMELPVRERGVCCTPPRRMRADRVAELTDVMKALADPTRLEIVGILRDAKEPICICDLATAFDLSQPTLSHHMAKLKAAGLVESGKSGIWCFYSLRTDLPPQVRRIVEVVAQHAS